MRGYETVKAWLQRFFTGETLSLRPMLRGWFIFVLGLGMFSAMLSNGSRSSRASAFEPKSGEAATASDSSYAVEDPDNGSVEDGAVKLERNPDGHFYVDVEINGSRIHALVDTGASGIALSRQDARNAGLAPSIGMNEVIGRGADGDVHGEVVRLDKVSLGHRTAEDMPAIVLDSGEQSLLGQSFLSKFDAVEIRGDTMVLR